MAAYPYGSAEMAVSTRSLTDLRDEFKGRLDPRLLAAVICLAQCEIDGLAAPQTLALAEQFTREALNAVLDLALV